MRSQLPLNELSIVRFVNNFMQFFNSWRAYMFHELIYRDYFVLLSSYLEHFLKIYLNIFFKMSKEGAQKCGDMLQTNCQ